MEKTKAKKSTSVVTTKPVVPSIIFASADIAERGLTTSFDLAQDFRAEIKSVTDATLNYADTVVKTTFEFMRSVADRVDQLATTSIDQSKSTALLMVGAARNTGARATELAADALTGATETLADAVNGTVVDLAGDKSSAA